MRQILPVAGPAEIRRHARRLARRHPRTLLVALLLHGLAAVSGLAAPRLIGNLVQDVQHGTTAAKVNVVIAVIAGFIVAQSLLTRWARYKSFALGEQVLAELREEFVDNALALPIGTVERAGTGDLLSRTSRDVDTLSRTVRFAVPETIIAFVTVVFTAVATVLVGVWVLVPLVAMVPLLWLSTKWYLRRAKDGYLRENAAYAQMTSSLAETVEGARTVEALRRFDDRVRRGDDDIRGSYNAERYTLFLRTVYFPAAELGYLVPVVGTLLFGGWLHLNGHASLGAVTAAVLYVNQLIDPVDRLLSWLDELQSGGAAFARLLGISDVPDDRTPSGREPSGELVEARDVRFSYVDGRDVLHGVDLTIQPGERIAMVGPSGAGKSTLGRLVAGIHPPRTGSVTVGGVGMTDLPLDELRKQVALVTQEHHVFVGTLRDNLSMARPSATDTELLDALGAVDAREWAEALPDGLDTRVGSGQLSLTPAQAQQLALARLVLADPHTLVLDEATSLIDPRAARHMERSLAAVLEGRTVIAIAHRLYTAHDADRVAVVEDGRITELGSHDELVARQGSYAALWNSWHG
ncbi:ABC transporter ATP-binding protein [Kribbella jejuensis]|uniref:ABC-type multidrug transport system fused ATPase/permease subunit n=1 Tax=Kribbella jejuensis TaxID=236068 RepID=A0A542ERA9_9ACTN|nr:ABC transporter ATP-binding protein [Kribbella jejuensis]TQJ17855.1 ABC-type multidrug transport system fused ATPase/permease subunit [Kribbella jejuensis]